MTAGPPTEPPILTAEQVAEMFARLTYPNTPHWVNARRVCDSHEALRARLRDAEETLARDARKAALAEAVVEAAESYLGLSTYDSDPRTWNTVVFDSANGLGEALAALRAEYPADPQEGS